MTEPGSAASQQRFVVLWRTLLVLLVAYPYFPDNALGSFAGGLMSLAILVVALRAAHRERRVFVAGSILAIIVMSVDILSYTWQRGHAVVEASFAIFYAWATLAIVKEVFRDDRGTFDTVRGAAQPTF